MSRTSQAATRVILSRPEVMYCICMVSEMRQMVCIWQVNFEIDEKLAVRYLSKEVVERMSRSGMTGEGISN